MTEGETKTINLTADEAYGQVRPEAIVTAPRHAFPPDFEFEVGLRVQGQGPAGPVQAKILSFNEEHVELDHNHPLAGKDINFEIELVEIEAAATDTNTAEKSFGDHTLKELRAFAKEKGIRGFSRMKKADLITALSEY